MLAIVFLAALAALSLISKAPYVFASNDWDTPCLDGSCTYEAGDGNSTAYYLLAVNGTSSTVSDITPASGWTISGCNADSPHAQTIELTCDPSGANAANCAHFLSSNPVNKIVRLPDSCGAGPFARVATWSNSTAAKRDGAVVQTCSFDYNFTQVPASGTPVSFSIYGTSAPGVLDNQTVTTAVTAALRAQRRSFPRRSLPRRSSISSIIGAISGTTLLKKTVSVTDNVKFSPGKTTVLSQSLNCGKAKEELTIIVDPGFESRIDIAFAVEGQLIPPKLKDIALSATLNADTKAIFDIVANVNGDIDSGVKTLFQTGLPGLNVPGLFSVGPTFTINTQVTANVRANLETTIAIQENFAQLQFIFPPKSGKSSLVESHGTPAPKLSIAATGSAAGEVRAALIPKIDFGVNVLKGLVGADIFLEADLALDFKASVSGPKKPKDLPSNSTSPIAGMPTNASNSSLIPANGTSFENSTSSTMERRANQGTTLEDVPFSGSLELDFTIDVKAGASANILDFDRSKTIDIFDKTVPLFQKSFGGPNKRHWSGGPKKGHRSRRVTPASLATPAKRGFVCSPYQGDLSNVV